jgi:hypothetical protein
MNEKLSEKDIEKEKWDFDDYAFTITWIIVGILIVVPLLLDIILEIIFNIDAFSGVFVGEAPSLIDFLHGYNFLSPALFLLTTTIVYFKAALDARKCEYSDSWFTYDFESTLELAISLAISTLIVYISFFIDEIWASWLGAPIAWILFLVIVPFARKKDSTKKTNIPWLCLIIFITGVVAEVITREWISLPLSWLAICAIMLIGHIRKAERSLDTVYDISFSILSIIAMVLGIVLDFWYISWSPILLALLLCWIFSKFKRFKK